MLLRLNFSTFEFVATSMHLCVVLHKTVFFSLLFVSFACQRNEKANLTPLYFDLPNYFKVETERQMGKNIYAEVRWEKDGVTEVKKEEVIDWKKAFKALQKLDLNRTAYRGGYKVDTSGNENQLAVNHVAQTAAMNPQTVRLQFASGKLVKLELQVADKNFLYESVVHYSYVPDDTLRISGTQQVIFGEKHSYKRSYWY